MKEQTRIVLPTLAVSGLLLVLGGLASWYLHHSLRDPASTDRAGWALLLLGVTGALAGTLAGFAMARGVQHRLLNSQRALDRSEQLATLGRVAAALAHELRNPLTSMRIITQSARSDDDPVTVDATDFAILEQEIERLDSSIQMFLDYARPPRPDKRPCDVQALVRKSVALVQRRAAQMGVAIREQFPAEPINIDTDPAQMHQVLLNILINALDVSSSGGEVFVRVRVTSGNDDPTSGSKLWHSAEIVEIAIADAGVGLPVDLGPRIFDAFVSTKETGTGLGLAICKRIIDDHGGELVARSGDQGGAVLIVRLPKRQPPAVQSNMSS